jgi:hypothetical protein
MADDPSIPDQPAKESATVLGKLTFTRLREEAAVRAQANRLAKLQRKNAVRRQLVMRMLNKGKGKPRLRVVK